MVRLTHRFVVYYLLRSDWFLSSLSTLQSVILIVLYFSCKARSPILRSTSHRHLHPCLHSHCHLSVLPPPLARLYEIYEIFNSLLLLFYVVFQVGNVHRLFIFYYRFYALVNVMYPFFAHWHCCRQRFCFRCPFPNIYLFAQSQHGK